MIQTAYCADTSFMSHILTAFVVQKEEPAAKKSVGHA